jgi:hypothetical protein
MGPWKVRYTFIAIHEESCGVTIFSLRFTQLNAPGSMHEEPLYATLRGTSVRAGWRAAESPPSVYNAEGHISTAFKLRFYVLPLCLLGRQSTNWGTSRHFVIKLSCSFQAVATRSAAAATGVLNNRFWLLQQLDRSTNGEPCCVVPPKLLKPILIKFGFDCPHLTSLCFCTIATQRLALYEGQVKRPALYSSGI